IALNLQNHMITHRFFFFFLELPEHPGTPVSTTSSSLSGFPSTMTLTT
ncbi:hypothetical protein TL16_g03243, partial [Triparma laevis f. inornata]